LYRTDPLCGSRHCVIAKMHRSRPCMVGAANKCELDPALSGDGLDNSQWAAEFLQDGPLLDVEFNVPESVGVYTSARNLFRIWSEFLHRLAHGYSLLILRVREFVV